MIKKIGKHEWEITVNGEDVIHLFDEGGSETFDPTEATEAATESRIIKLWAGDRITFERFS